MLPSQNSTVSWCLICSRALQFVRHSPNHCRSWSQRLTQAECADANELHTKAWQRGQLSFSWVVLSVLPTPALLSLWHGTQEVQAKQPFRKRSLKPSLPSWNSTSASFGLWDFPLVKLNLQLCAGKHFQFPVPKEENWSMCDSDTLNRAGLLVSTPNNFQTFYIRLSLERIE